MCVCFALHGSWESSVSNSGFNNKYTFSDIEGVGMLICANGTNFSLFIYASVQTICTLVFECIDLYIVVNYTSKGYSKI